MWVWVLKLLSTSRDSSGTDGWTLRTCKSTDRPAQGHSEGRTTSSTGFTPADMDDAFLSVLFSSTQTSHEAALVS